MSRDEAQRFPVKLRLQISKHNVFFSKLSYIYLRLVALVLIKRILIFIGIKDTKSKTMQQHTDVYLKFKTEHVLMISYSEI